MSDSEIDKKCAEFHKSIKVEEYYPFELGAAYFDANKNRLTFGLIFRAGARALLEIAASRSQNFPGSYAECIDIDELRKIVEGQQ